MLEPSYASLDLSIILFYFFSIILILNFISHDF